MFDFFKREPIKRPPATTWTESEPELPKQKDYVTVGRVDDDIIIKLHYGNGMTTTLIMNPGGVESLIKQLAVNIDNEYRIEIIPVYKEEKEE